VNNPGVEREDFVLTDQAIKLVPGGPPGRSSRRARSFAAEMCALRAQGYTFEAIREALAAAGVHVSNATVQREVARAAASVVPARPLVLMSAAVTTPAPIDARRGKDIAESFMQGRITNPLLRAKQHAKECP
jgi:predicted DNA-binding protein (UPF0251 family)